MDRIKKHKQWIIIAVFAIAVCSLLVSTFSFARDYRRLHLRGYLPGMHAWHSQRPPRVPTEQDVDRLETWMTFAFINHVFALPSGYLKDTLAITDPKYPNVSIEAAAKSKGITKDVLLITIKDLLRKRIALPAETPAP